MLVTVIARHGRGQVLLMRCGGDVVSRCLNYRPGHYTSAEQPAAADFPVFVAGANFLVSGRRVWAGEASTE